MTPFIIFMDKSGMVSTDRENSQGNCFWLINFRLKSSRRGLII
jgi:hypothetical protein